jgi:hypothetical protein
MHKISYLNQIYSIQKEETRSTLSRKRTPDQLYPERGNQINSIQKDETLLRHILLSINGVFLCEAGNRRSAWDD